MANVTCCLCDTSSSKSDSSCSVDPNETLLRISVSETLSESSQNAQDVKCVRCGHSLDRNRAIFVTVRPPFVQHKSKISVLVNSGTRCTKCLLPDSLHCRKRPATGSSDSGLDASSRDSPTLSSDSGTGEEFQGGTSDEEKELQNHSDICPQPCTDCHIAMIRERGRSESRVLGLPETITLMLQVPVSSDRTKLNGVQGRTDESKSNPGVGDNIQLETCQKVCTEDSAGGALTGTGSYKGGVPSMDPEAEAAYRSHLRNLIPCMHCGRTFNPDRVLRHENACVERPRRRKLKALATA